MFRAPLRPSSGAHDNSVGYHIGRLVLEFVLDGRLSAGRMGCVTAFGPETHPSCVHLRFHPAATREPDDLCGNQRHRRELLMMGVMVTETF
jgi:hypothetical protein